jgi:methionyl-tRNA formyltransferase
MDLIYFGSGAFGVPTLAALSRTHRLRAIVTQPDRPAGRGGSLTPTPVAEWAQANLPTVPLFQPENVNQADMVATIRAHAADAWVVIAFGQKLGKALLDGVFAINLHASLLPRWRGAAPINAAILGGDSMTGNSVITLADRMDAGLVLGQSERPIDPARTAGELHDALAADGPALVESVLARHAAGTLAPIQQDESLVTIAPKLSKADAWVDFNATPEESRRRIHALTPWPGVSVQFRDQPLKLLRVQPDPRTAESGGAGTIIDPEAGLVRCGGACLRLIEVQPAGKRAMPWADFARGARLQSGERLIGGAAT